MLSKEMQREALKYILKQYDRAERHIKELEARLDRINAERESPIGSPGYDPLPRVMTPGSGAASVIIKLSEIEERIYEQRGVIERAMVRVMDIIDFIPSHEIARRIFELRHIDCLDFQNVADAIPMSKSRCYEIYNETIDWLLTFPKIRKMVRDVESEFIDWSLKQDKRRPKSKAGDEDLERDPEKQSGGISPGFKSRKRKRKRRS